MLYTIVKMNGTRVECWYQERSDMTDSFVYERRRARPYFDIELAIRKK